FTIIEPARFGESREADHLPSPCRLERMTMSTHKPRHMKKTSTRRGAPAKPSRDGDAPQVILLLQGGGALGAYHIGAYDALHESGMEPEWIAGVSIGAFNACVLAGNAPADRVAKLEGLWDTISRPERSEEHTSELQSLA